jgi:hypothetical protein
MCATQRGAAVKLGEDEIVSLLNEAKYLFLRDISEPEENSLRLVVEEAIADHTQTISTTDPASPFAEILKGAAPVKAVEGCRRFEIQWSRYVAYLVTEESVGSGGNYEDEIYTGKLFREYTKSHFLDLLARDTGGHFEPILHYKLICQNHLIDVAAYGPPEVRLLENSGTKLKPN